MSDLDTALALEQRLLYGLYPLPCGCMLPIVCSLPGENGIINLTAINTRRNCERHLQRVRRPRMESHLGLLADVAPATWMHWFRRGPNGPLAVTPEEFEREFEAAHARQVRTPHGEVRPHMVIALELTHMIHQSGETTRIWEQTQR